MNYWRKYIGDYQRDTARLTLAQHGAYHLLLDELYATEAPLPLDKEEIYRVLRATKADERAAIDFVLVKFFTRKADGYHNARADEELGKVAKCRVAGRLGNEIRWGGGPDQDGPDGGPDADQAGGVEAERDTGRDAKRDTGRDTGRDAKRDAKRVSRKASRIDRLPTTNHQPPTANHQPPTAISQPPETATATEALARSREKRVETWKAYSTAYAIIYGVEPVQNAMVRKQVAQLVERIGADAPAVATFYVGHPDAFYVRRGHPIGQLLANAEKIRTEWATGRMATATRARQVDRAATTQAIVEEIIRENDERDAAPPHLRIVGES
jgi:hypothetical protein